MFVQEVYWKEEGKIVPYPILKAAYPVKDSGSNDTFCQRIFSIRRNENKFYTLWKKFYILFLEIVLTSW